MWIPWRYQKFILFCLQRTDNHIYGAQEPSITCGKVTEYGVWSKIWLIWEYILNGLLLGVIVLRGIFLWMVLLLVILGKLNQNTHCSFHQTLHGVSNILQWLSLYTPKFIFYLRGDKVSENLQKRGVWNFQINGDSQNRGF